MNIALYIEFLYLNYFKIVDYTKELEISKEDSLYYVEEIMQDSQSLLEQINDLICERHLNTKYSQIAENLLDEICDVYEKYKQKSDEILGFRDYGWAF